MTSPEPSQAADTVITDESVTEAARKNLRDLGWSEARIAKLEKTFLSMDPKLKEAMRNAAQSFVTGMLKAFQEVGLTEDPKAKEKCPRCGSEYTSDGGGCLVIDWETRRCVQSPVPIDDLGFQKE